ncbi:hypothetical protein EX895_004229 [Sporisorium graminicola]|uniref:Uncharacterized protein n=1 Tax=Sporisorium graminicola TaxID=280036 RepID=A0A4U7KR81_9BASI|nr:hypothetical protein EX895_004229 [Sporisorium graminicola]TKY86941.1 hypothetical protein EX895_004229 [Sporisorium graminicola]
MMSQRSVRSTPQPTTASWTRSDQYEPLATAPPTTPQQELDLGDKLEKPHEHRLRTWLERIEHNQAATRVFWFFVGFYSSALLCGAIIVAIMRK